MLGAEAAYRHSLHATRTAVVAQRNAGQTVQGVGHVRHPHRQHVVAVQQVHGGRTAQRVLATVLRNGDALQLVDTAADGVRLRHSTGGKQEQQTA